MFSASCAAAVRLHKTVVKGIFQSMISLKYMTRYPILPLFQPHVCKYTVYVVHKPHHTSSVIFEGGTGQGLTAAVGKDLLTQDHIKRSGADRRSSPILWRGPGAAPERVTAAGADRENPFTFSAVGEMDVSI